MNTNTIRLALLLLCAIITQQKIYQCNSNAPCGCSLNSASVSARITGGEPAVSNTWSWATSLRIDQHICGGAVISDSYIMTAAHCVQQASASDITVFFGSTNLLEGQARAISQIYLDPRYYQDPSGHYVLNDIALFKLSTSLNMADMTFGKVCLPKSDLALPNNTNVIAIGWGSVYDDGLTPSETLQQVTLNFIDSITSSCTSIARNATTQFCAGIMPYGGKDTCQGDSGGPLMAFNNDNLWEVQGVVSYGEGCGKRFKPGVYTRVGSYFDWINQTMMNGPSPSSSTTMMATTSNKVIISLACFVIFILFK